MIRVSIIVVRSVGRLIGDSKCELVGLNLWSMPSSCTLCATKERL